MTQTALVGFDTRKMNAFSEALLGILNNGALALMISIGHRTGLFDALGDLPPITSRELALRTGLAERYVREWLGAMVSGGLVEYEAEDETYALPPEHAALLTREAAPQNLAVVAQFLPLLAGVEDELVACFREGGGVPYSSYPRFHEIMAEQSDQTVVSGLIERIVPLVEGLWEELARGIDVLDVGCGRGRALLRLAQAFPHSRFTGHDLSADAVAEARAEAAELGLDNLRFEVRDAAGLEDEERFDLVTAFDAIHDQADPAAVLAGIRAALRPGGTFLMQDIAVSSRLEKNLEHPLAPLVYTISCMHCMTVSLAREGAGLGAAWGEETALRMLSEAGFGEARIHRLPHDLMNAWYVVPRD